MSKKKAGLPVSYSTHRRVVRNLLKLIEAEGRASVAAYAERDAALNSRMASERRLKDLSALYQTGEAYYRAQRIIADILNREDAAISANLKDEILAALYHGRSNHWVGESRARGSSTDVEVLEGARLLK